MKATQLAESIARAVEAAKPAQEYCFLWIDWWPMCMTKAEWSGWMQAIFSVVAILAAACLTWWQLNEPRKAAELAEQRQDLELASAALKICERANRLARSTVHGFDHGLADEWWFSKMESRWENLLACLDSLLAKNLDGEALQLVLDSRGFAAVGLAICREKNSKMHTRGGLSNMFDTFAIRRDTAEARWKLRRIVRARRAAIVKA